MSNDRISKRWYDADRDEYIWPADDAVCAARADEICTVIDERIKALERDLQDHPAAGWEECEPCLFSDCRKIVFLACHYSRKIPNPVVIGHMEYIKFNDNPVPPDRWDSRKGMIPIMADIPRRKIWFDWNVIKTGDWPT